MSASSAAAKSTPVGGLSVLNTLRFAFIFPLLRVEVFLLHALQGLRARLPRSVRRTMDKLISAHPLYDLTLALWLCIPWALASLGWRLFWPLCLNILVGFLLAWFVGGPIPGDLIDWLKPRARLSPSGFPCIELQVASCLLLYVGWWHSDSPGVVAACCAAFATLLLLRLYALTHFPHQLVLSAAMGAGSVPACRRLGRYLFQLPVPVDVHLLGAFVFGSLFLGYICYYAETNEVPFARIPQAECAFLSCFYVCPILRSRLPLLSHSSPSPLPPLRRLAVTRVLTGIMERSEEISDRDYRASRRRSGDDAAEDSDSTPASSSSSSSARFPPPASGAGGELRRRGGVPGGPTYPPAGPSASSGVPPSFPPAGPQLGELAGSEAGSARGGAGSGMSRGGGGGLNLSQRAPRDSLYYLLKQTLR